MKIMILRKRERELKGPALRTVAAFERERAIRKEVRLCRSKRLLKERELKGKGSGFTDHSGF